MSEKDILSLLQPDQPPCLLNVLGGWCPDGYDVTPSRLSGAFQTDAYIVTEKFYFYFV